MLDPVTVCGDSDLLLTSELALFRGAEIILAFTTGFFLLYTCLYLRFSTSSLLFGLTTTFVPGPDLEMLQIVGQHSIPLILLSYLASTTWDQSLVELKGSFFHLLTMRTQALHMSPCLRSLSLILKHPRKLSAYLLLSVNREL